MFDHLISTNNLQEEFAKHHLDETDLIFIKELIIGPGKDRGRDEVSCQWSYLKRKFCYKQEWTDHSHFKLAIFSSLIY